MRILILGDIHGRDIWKQIVANEIFDKIIFIGDYFDTYDISVEIQKQNFRDIIAYKIANMDKVILLFGNHDFHYLKNAKQHYSGFQAFQKIDIQELLEPNIKNGLIQMCYIYDNLLFSHAGITKTWCKDNDIDLNNIQNDINDLFLFNSTSFHFAIGKNRCLYGDDINQSPIWVRPNSLKIDKIDNYIQIVGHTVQDNIILTNDIILIDTLGTSKEYLIYDNGKFNISKLN